MAGTSLPDPTASRWTRRLACPHCHGEFDYALVPGASVTAIRLGTSRYMRCPLCHRFAVFPLRRSSTEREGRGFTPPAGTGAPQPTVPGEALPSRRADVPRFNDRRPMARWGAILLIPAVVLTLLGVALGLAPGIALLLDIAGVVVLCVGAGLLVAFSLPDRVPPRR